MDTDKKNEGFTDELMAKDWRYSAAIVGIHQYLSYFDLAYEIEEDTLRFHKEDITEERYLMFVEQRYWNDMYHTRLKEVLQTRELSEEQKKFAGELLQGNTIMKKVFGKLKAEPEQKEEILYLIESNRSQLIMETFRNKKNMYANFANKGKLFTSNNPCCRLLGFDEDMGRKGKSMSYQFDVNTFLSEDTCYFDFIPFAFAGDRDTFFVNDNYSIKQLLQTNRMFSEKVKNAAEDTTERGLDARRILCQAIKETSDFIYYDVEVIGKSRDVEHYETIFLRKESIQILREIDNYGVFCFSHKVNEKYYINGLKEVMNCILNLLRTDMLIDVLLKANTHNYRVKCLIDLNVLICKGGQEMKQLMKVAKACAIKTAEKMEENKLKSYREKLTSAMVFKDYDRVCTILLQLSNYVGMFYGFADGLYEDFEANKDVAYTFINSLHKTQDYSKVKQED